MRKFFSKDNPPNDYGHCMNHGCPRSATCLRYQLGKAEHSEIPFVRCLHPSCYPVGQQCQYYRPSAKVRVAWGVRYLWDDVPTKKAGLIKSKLIDHFGKGLYYAFYRKEIPLYPAEIEVVKKLFAEYGIEGEPAFESYSDEIDW